MSSEPPLTVDCDDLPEWDAGEDQGGGWGWKLFMFVLFALAVYGVCRLGKDWHENRERADTTCQGRHFRFEYEGETYCVGAEPGEEPRLTKKLPSVPGS